MQVAWLVRSLGRRRRSSLRPWYHRGWVRLGVAALLSVLTLATPRLCASLQAAPAGRGQEEPRRVLVVPFDVTEEDTRWSWLGEAAAILLEEALGSDLAVPRSERARAFRELHLPPVGSLSRATVIKVGRLVGATQIVLGTVDAREARLGVGVRRIQLDTGRMPTELADQGPPSDLYAIFDRLARRLSPSARTPYHPPLPAFEAYVKGLVARTPSARTQFLSEAIRLHPGYDRARLALWEVESEDKQHARALAVALAVAEGSPYRRAAQFRAALSELALDRLEEAFDRWKALASVEPVATVYNNLGVVQLRRPFTPQTGRPTYYFNKAVDQAPHDADSLFNLGYAYWQERDTQAAIYWLRETVRRAPADADAHFVLGAALEVAGAKTEAAREKDLARKLSSRYEQGDRGPADADAVPSGLERLKGSLEDAASRFDSAVVATEQRAQRELAAFHFTQGRKLFESRRDREAIAELRRSIYLAPYEPEPHLLLGRLHLRAGRAREAIDALKIAVWSEETADGHVLLGEAYLQVDDLASARKAAERALALEPSNTEARRLLERLDPSPR